MGAAEVERVQLARALGVDRPEFLDRDGWEAALTRLRNQVGAEHREQLDRLSELVHERYDGYIPLGPPDLVDASILQSVVAEVMQRTPDGQQLSELSRIPGRNANWSWSPVHTSITGHASCVRRLARHRRRTTAHRYDLQYLKINEEYGPGETTYEVEDIGTWHVEPTGETHLRVMPGVTGLGVDVDEETPWPSGVNGPDGATHTEFVRAVHEAAGRCGGSA